MKNNYCGHNKSLHSNRRDGHVPEFLKARLQEGEQDFLSLRFEASVAGLLITYMERIIIRAVMNLLQTAFIMIMFKAHAA